MKEFLSWARAQLKVDPKLLLTYCIIYFSWGMLMDLFGTQVEIERFSYWWQVIT